MAHANLDVLPASPDEADRLIAGSRTTYADGLVTQRRFGAADAMDKAVADVAALLPEGPGTPGHFFLAARRSGIFVGGVWVALQGPERVGTAWVYHLEVEPSARRQGVAARLMAAAAAGARERGATHLGLNVFGDNTGAVALYDRLGYTVTAQQMTRPLDAG